MSNIARRTRSHVSIDDHVLNDNLDFPDVDQNLYQNPNSVSDPDYKDFLYQCYSEAVEQGTDTNTDDNDPAYVYNDDIFSHGWKFNLDEELLQQQQKEDTYGPEFARVLNQQLRQHIQLLTQTCLLAKSMKNMQNEADEAKEHLNSYMKIFKDRKKPSNLLPAIQLVNDFGTPKELKSSVRLSWRPLPVPEAAKTLIDQNPNVFPYADLLPQVAFSRLPDKLVTKKPKIIFTLNEDKLLALALNEFKGESSQYAYIASLLLAAKTKLQINNHIKNIKRSPGNEDNPVKLYFSCGRLPHVDLDSDNRLRDCNHVNEERMFFRELGSSSGSNNSNNNLSSNKNNNNNNNNNNDDDKDAQRQNNSPAKKGWLWSWDTGTRVYLVDTKESISVVRNEDKNTCEPIRRDAIMQALGFGFIDFSMGEHEYIFGAARLLHYFGRMRSELKADVEGWYRKKNLGSLRYTKQFTSSSGDKIDVSVYYSIESLSQQARPHALPLLIRLELPQLDIKGVEIDFSPIKYTEGDSLGDNPQFELNFDSLLLEPVTGCSEAVAVASAAAAASSDPGSVPPSSSGTLEGLGHIDRFSFRASVRLVSVSPHRRHLRAPPNGQTFQVQVAHDSIIKKMRIDLSSASSTTANTTKIYDFVMGRLTHILPHSNGRHHLEGATSIISYNDNAESNPAISKLNHHLDATISAAQSHSSQKLETFSTSQCVQADLETIATHLVGTTIDYLLLGTNKDFIYMGLARIRGIRARVFEAVDTHLPVWIEAQAHSSQGGPSDKSTQFVTLVYFSIPNQGDDARLLLVEIYEVYGNYELLVSKREISVFDFAWNLQAIRARPLDASLSTSASGGGDSALSLFSLVNYCPELDTSNPEADGQVANESRARFEMILESAEPVARSTHEWLGENLPGLRLALLNSLQLDMNIIFGLIYDLDTRIILDGNYRINQSSTNLSEKQLLRLVVSFNVGRLHSRLSKLMYLGERWNIESTWWFVHVLSMQECFLLASHSWREMEFIYDWKSGSCYIAPLSFGKKHQHGEQVGETIQLPYSMSVFQTFKIDEQHKESSSEQWWIREPLLDNNNTKLNTTTLNLEARTPIGLSTIKMLIRHLKVYKHKAHVTYLDDYGGYNSPDEPSRMLLGFGLLEQAGLSQAAVLHNSSLDSSDEMVESSVATSNVSEERMTAGQCQAMCQANFRCRSYSYCIRGSKIECILSQANLNPSKVIAKIASILRERRVNKISDKRLEVEIDNDDDGGGKTMVSLVKNHGCAVYRKQYSDNYSVKVRNLSVIESMLSLRQVADVEECSSVCLRTMLNSLRDRHIGVASHLTKLANGETLSGAGHNESLDLLERVRQFTEDSRDIGCRGFYFIEAENMKRVPEEKRLRLQRIMRSIRENQQAASNSSSEGQQVDHDATSDNYCVLLTQDRSNDQLDKLGIRVQVDYYGSKLEQLYEQTHGVRMRRSQLTDDEYDALNHVMYYGNMKPSIDSINVVSGLLERGENFQLEMMADRKRCAELCFTQSSGLWPQCRSFDIVIQQQQQITETENRTRIRCFLNSLSRRQAMDLGRLDLVDASHAFDLNEQRWHYELKEALLLPVQQVTNSMHPPTNGPPTPWANQSGRHQDNTTTTTNSFSVLLLMCSTGVGIVLGLLTAYKLHELERLRKIRRRNSYDSANEFSMT